MAKILRGKYKGADVKIHQFCNDWFVVNNERIPNIDSVFSPTAFEFSVEEVERIRETKNTGNMFQRFKWKENRLVKI